MGATSVTIEKILKETYAPKVRDAFYTRNKGAVLFKDSTQNFGAVGRQLYAPLTMSRSMGVGAPAENAAIPTAGNVAYERMLITLAKIVGVIRITAEAIEQSKSDPIAFERALEAEMKGIQQGMSFADEAALFSTIGGAMATLTATANSATHTVNSNRRLCPGMQITVWDATIYAGGGTAQASTDSTPLVVAYTSGDTSVTFTASASLTSGHYLHIAGTRSATVNYLPAPLSELIDDGTISSTIHGVTRSTYGDQMKSTITDVGGVAVSQILLAQFCRKMKLRSQAQNLTFLTGDDFMIELMRINFDNRQFQTSEGKLGIDDVDLRFGTTAITIVESLQCPAATCYVPDFENMGRVVNREMGIWDEDGNALLRVNGVHALEGSFREVSQRFNLLPMTSGIFKGWSTTAAGIAVP